MVKFSFYYLFFRLEKIIRRWEVKNRKMIEKMIEKILILENGERWIDEIDDLDRRELLKANALILILDDPVTLSVFLFTARFQENGYSWEAIMEAVYDEEFVERRNIEGALEKLLACGLLAEKWINENGKWQLRFFNNPTVAPYFAEFSDAATEKQLKQMSGEEIVNHWLKLTKSLFLEELS